MNFINIPTSEKYPHRLVFHCNKIMKEQIKKEANNKNVAMSEIIREIITNYYKKNEKPKRIWPLF